MEEEKALVVKDKVDAKVIEDFLFASNTKITKEQKTLFLAIAIRNQLDPFKREIHPVPYKKDDGTYALSIVTGYEVYLKRAEASNKLDGWKVWTEGTGKDLKAKIKITRKDWKEPFEHEVEIEEYNLHRSLWNMKPKTMLKKVVMAQGFRLAFPEELGGMPYTADEIDNKEAIDVTPETTQPDKNEAGKEIPPLQGQTNFLEEMKRYRVKVGKDKWEEILVGRYNHMKPEDVPLDDQKGILEEMEKAHTERMKK